MLILRLGRGGCCFFDFARLDAGFFISKFVLVEG